MIHSDLFHTYASKSLLYFHSIYHMNLILIIIKELNG